jgi:oligoribonuclease
MGEYRFSIVDIETFGLRFLDDPVLEIGISLRDTNLNEIDRFHSLVWDEPYYQLLLNKHRDEDTFVFNMHQRSNLWEQAFEKGEETEVVVQNLEDWLNMHGVTPEKDYLVGSSVHFDSTMMHFNFNEARSHYHHRMIDVSSIKVLTEALWPNMAKRLKEETAPKKEHRVLADIEDTVSELQWYLNNVLPEGDEINA